MMEKVYFSGLLFASPSGSSNAIKTESEWSENIFGQDFYLIKNFSAIKLLNVEFSARIN